MSKIILEGPDGAGKTSLGDTLCKLTGYPIVHLTNIKNAELMHKQFETARTIDNVILDRYALSNLVYSSVFNNKPVNDLQKYWDDMKRGCLIICLPFYYTGGIADYEKLYRQLVTIRTEMYPDITMMCKVWEYYKHVYETLKLEKYSVYVFDYSVDRDYTNIKQFLNL